MTSPALGIAYVFWLRLRWLAAAVIVLVPVFATAVRLFPGTALYCQFASLILFFSALVPLLNACTFGPADLAARTSGLPAHMFVLPMSNPSLVGWPMLFAAIILSSFWGLVAVLVFIPADVPLPVVWPATMLAAICVWVQATAWTPFPSPYIRVPALVIGVCPLILFPIGAGMWTPTMEGMVPILLVWSVVWSLAGYVVGIRGLSQARTGSEGSLYQNLADRVSTIIHRRVATRAVSRQPFPSASAAQLWHECRRNVLVMPVMLTIFGVPLLVMMCYSVIGSRDHSGIAIGSVVLSPSLMSLSICIGLPILLSAVGGSGMAKFDIWAKEEMPSFFAIRPMTTSRFILVKLTAVALCSMTIWAIMLGMVVVWALFEASPFNPRESMVRAAWAQATPEMVAILIAVLLALAALMWRNLLVAMWPTLIGRKWVSVSLSTWCIALFGGAILVGLWVYKHPDVRPLLPALVPWIVGYLLAEKVIGALAVGFALRRWGQMSANQLARLYACWLMLVCLLFAAVYCFTSPTWMLVAGVVLVVPFSRVAIFPLALHWNRHR